MRVYNILVWQKHKILKFTGIVLFTFLHFNETPAIVTSVVIGLGIVFCGGAVIHNVFIWQRVSSVIGDSGFRKPE